MSIYTKNEHDMCGKLYYIQGLLVQGLTSRGTPLKGRLLKAYTDFILKYRYINDCIMKEKYELQQVNKLENFHKTPAAIVGGKRPYDHYSDAGNDLDSWHAGGYNE